MLNRQNYFSSICKKLWVCSDNPSIYVAILIAISQLFFFNTAIAGTTYFTDIDNIDNSFSGPGDGDLDTPILDSDLIYPFEFNISATGSKPPVS